MKNHLIISLLFLLVGCSTSEKQSNKKIQIGHNKELKKEYNSNHIIEMDNGLWAEKFSDEPITGKVYGLFGEESNPKKVYIGNLLNGKKEGEWKSYHNNSGQKKYEEKYKDGKKNGLSIKWYSDGQKDSEGNYKDGKKDGLWKDWHKNGMPRSEMIYKNGFSKESIFIKDSRGGKFSWKDPKTWD